MAIAAAAATQDNRVEHHSQFSLGAISRAPNIGDMHAILRTVVRWTSGRRGIGASRCAGNGNTVLLPLVGIRGSAVQTDHKSGGLALRDRGVCRLRNYRDRPQALENRVAIPTNGNELAFALPDRIVRIDCQRRTAVSAKYARAGVPSDCAVIAATAFGVQEFKIIAVSCQQVDRRRDVFKESAALVARTATFAGGIAGPFTCPGPLRFTRDLELIGRFFVGAQEQSAAVVGRAGESVVTIGIDLKQTDGTSEIGFDAAQIRDTAGTAGFEIRGIKLMGWLIIGRDGDTHIIGDSGENVAGKGVVVIRSPLVRRLVDCNVDCTQLVTQTMSETGRRTVAVQVRPRRVFDCPLQRRDRIRGSFGHLIDIQNNLVGLRARLGAADEDSARNTIISLSSGTGGPSSNGMGEGKKNRIRTTQTISRAEAEPGIGSDLEVGELGGSRLASRSRSAMAAATQP